MMLENLFIYIFFVQNVGKIAMMIGKCCCTFIMIYLIGVSLFVYFKPEYCSLLPDKVYVVEL